MQHIAGGVVYNLKTDMIVVVNQNNDSWSLPKGHIEANETPRETAVREIWEETGIPSEKLHEVSPLGFYERLKIKRYPDDSDDPRIITLYLFTTDHEELAPHDPTNPRALWLPLNEVASLLTHPKDKEFFANIKAGIEHRVELLKNPPHASLAESGSLPEHTEKGPNEIESEIPSNDSEDEHGHQHEKTTPI